MSEPIVLTLSIQNYKYRRLQKSSYPVESFLDSAVEGTNLPEPEESDVVAKRPRTSSLSSSTTNGTTCQLHAVPGTAAECVRLSVTN